LVVLIIILESNSKASLPPVQQTFSPNILHSRPFPSIFRIHQFVGFLMGFPLRIHLIPSFLQNISSFFTFGCPPLPSHNYGGEEWGNGEGREMASREKAVVVSPSAGLAKMVAEQPTGSTAAQSAAGQWAATNRLGNSTTTSPSSFLTSPPFSHFPHFFLLLPFCFLIPSIHHSAARVPVVAWRGGGKSSSRQFGQGDVVGKSGGLPRCWAGFIEEEEGRGGKVVVLLLLLAATATTTATTTAAFDSFSQQAFGVVG
jgi:hypothetical protein